MKKSEMIDILNDFFNDRMNSYAEISNVEFLAEDTLTIIENAGMQPPLTNLDSLFPNSGLKQDKPYSLFNLWEPEDLFQEPLEIVSVTPIKKDNE